MGYKETDKVSAHSVPGQQPEQKDHIQQGCENIIPHAGLLLAQPLCHSVGEQVAVEHGDEQRVQTQISACLRVGVQPQTQGFCKQEHERPEKAPVDESYSQASPNQILHPLLTLGGVAPGKFRDQQLAQTEENGGGEHKHRKHHAADRAESG